MKLEAYAIHDAKAKVFTSPFFQVNRNVALRSFSVAINDPQHQYGQSPADYTLFLVGEYDDQVGRLKAIEPNAVANGVELQK